jgi:hypothetical protein
MKSPKMLRREAAQRKQFMKKVFPYVTAAVLFIILIFTMGCAKPGKEPRDVSQYRVELGKKCLIKEDGSVAWSYVWIADQNVTLVKCK